MDLDRYMAEKTAFVDRRLNAAMPGGDTPPEVLHRAMRYALFPAGKRIRPVLCLAAAEAVGADCECAALPAVAVELLHSYTLIHDDLPCMDDDDMRRGKPACHIEFGEANAVLAGDALQALAFEVLAGHEPADRAVRMIAELAGAAGSLGVAGGQVADLAFGTSRPSPELVDYIHIHKTADLFRAAAVMGAVAAGAGEGELEAVARYGTCLGIAFQITDDLLDLPPEGATVATDGASFLAVHDAETARDRVRSLVGDALAALAGLSGPGKDALTAMVNFVARRQH